MKGRDGTVGRAYRKEVKVKRKIYNEVDAREAEKQKLI